LVSTAALSSTIHANWVLGPTACIALKTARGVVRVGAAEVSLGIARLDGEGITASVVVGAYHTSSVGEALRAANRGTIVIARIKRRPHLANSEALFAGARAIHTTVARRLTLGVGGAPEKALGAEARAHKQTEKEGEERSYAHLQQG